MDAWEWFSGTTSAEAVIGGLGLLSLAVLFATDRILTKGQHERRVADLKAAHALVIQEKDANHVRELDAAEKRNAELLESRNWWRDSHNLQRDRADEAHLAMVAAGRSAVQLAEHVTTSFDQVVTDPTGTTA